MGRLSTAECTYLPTFLCAACRAVVPCLALLWVAAGCAVFFGAAFCALCCAAGCCCLLGRVSGRVVRLRCSHCVLLSGFGLPFRVLCCAVSLGAVLRRVAALCSARRCAVVCCVVLFRSFRAAAWFVVPSGAVRRPWVLCFPALCFPVFPRVVCSVLGVSCRCLWVRAVVRRCALCCVCVLCVSLGVVLCVPCPLRSVLCGAELCWCACVVLSVWSALFLVLGAVVRCCVLCSFLWCSMVRCWVRLPAVVLWWRVSVSVSLSCRVARFAVVGVVSCGALLLCVVFCRAVLSGGAVLSCSAVLLAHTQEADTRSGPNGQPDRARGTHRPHGMAYRQAKGRDTRAGQPATRTARDAREGRIPRGEARTGTCPHPRTCRERRRNTRPGH